ncbi:hypothetical protein [Nocardia sp. NRRL S-836]|uniref:hypothetical protein n=1 Tax=Nocardia sp. NRRL S-836 TaxID=1519492 RepID=UPI0006BEBABB|nr:hypothetical protein [Nocardia sp. NRRL S-836]KOV88305.1 hypothetical protein ADL03_05330 [Nocardia sp. NRRL S-836]
MNNGAIVPYVTAWTGERRVPYRLVARPGIGIGYTDEVMGDRDARGVLWMRAAVRHGAGRPEFGQVHPLRQRRAMRRLLCQVCAGPADRNGDGVLWLLRDHGNDWADWPEGMATVDPPVCVPCVAITLRLCPAMRRGAVAFRVREFRVAGVRGALYRGGTSTPGTAEAANLAFDDPDVRWLVASALVRELRGCTAIPPDLVPEAVAPEE